MKILEERLIAIRDVPKWCEKHLGNRVHPSTIYRWRMRGVRQIRLETTLVGGNRFTSEEALARFFQKSTEACDGTTQEMRPPCGKSIQDAESFLSSDGI